MPKQSSPLSPAAVRLKNLRPVPENEYPGLEPVSPLSPVIPGLEGYRPVASSGDILILAKENGLYRFSRGTDSGPVLFYSGTTPVRCACFVSESEIIVSDSLETFRTDIFSGSRTVSLKNLPPVILGTGDMAEISAILGSVSLSKEYNNTSDHTLAKTDLGRISSAMDELYSALLSAAGAGDRHLSPLLGRYRLLDAAGDTLFLSPPLLLKPEGEDATFPLARAVTIPLSGTATSAVTVRCPAFGVRVIIPGVTLPEVALLQIELSGDYSPIDKNAEVTAGINRSTHDGTFSIIARFPGALDRKSSLRQDIIDSLSSPLFFVAKKIRNPFCGEMREISVPLPDTGTKPAGNDETGGGASVEGKMFSVSSLCRCGETVIGANPRIFSSAVSCNPGCFLCGCEPAEGTSFCEFLIRYPSGFYSTFHISVKGIGAVSLNPLLAVTAAGASEIVLNVSAADGTEYRIRRDLTPTSSGNLSFFLSDDLEAIPLAGNEFSMPGLSDMPPVLESENSGCIISFPVTRCRSPKGITRVSDSPVQALCFGTGSSAGWDHVRSRFHIFSRDGIFTGVTDSAAAVVSIAKMSNHPVISGRDVAVTPEICYAMTADGALVSVSGNKTDVKGRFRYGHICYDNTFREIVVLPPENGAGNAEAGLPEAAVFSLRDGAVRFRTLPGIPSAHINPPDGCKAMIPGAGLCYFGVEDSPADSEIGMDLLHIPPVKKKTTGPAGREWQRLRINATSAGEVSLTLSVTADHGAGSVNSRTVFIRGLQGRINSPLNFSVPNPANRAFHISLRGTLPSCARIMNISINNIPLIPL